MAEFVGYADPGLSDQAGAGGRANLPLSTNVLAGRALPSDTFRALLVPPEIATSTPETVAPSVPPAFTYGGVEDTGLAPYWFELVHSFPSFFEFGNILAAITRDIEVYSSYRLDEVALQTVTHTAGTGVSLGGISGLPRTLAPQSSFIFQVHVTSSGPPSFEGEIIITLDVSVVRVDISGNRVVMFPYQPESPLEEVLEFRTTIMASADNTEQRISLRKNPRQKLNMLIRLEDAVARRKLHSLLHGWQPGVFGVPIWFEAKHLDEDASSGSTTVYVDTRHADYRELSLAIIWQDEDTYDALEVSSFTDTSITFSSALNNSYGSGAMVMPLRVATTEAEIGVRRAPVNLEDTNVVFSIRDNDNDLADTTAFPSYNSKVLLSEFNKMDGNFLSAGMQRKLLTLDNETGTVVQSSDWPGPSFITKKGFHCSTPQRLWEIRQLLHALHGQQKTFYLPTFYHDMVIAADTINADTSLDIEHIGYSTYIDCQAPSNHLWIELVDGTVFTKEIVASAEISSTIERLTLSDNWTAVIPVSDFARICYLRTARLGEDVITLSHTSVGEAEISVLVREVTG